ncbi:MAG: hypothetical protein IJP23_06310 [Oscillospiraceae bacterium]|nr:hypothetical protein [Oscillospiraceae bacterium]
MQFNIHHSGDYDANVSLKGRKVECFSPKYIKNTYPQGGCKVLGEMGGGKAKKVLGTVQVGRELHEVSPSGSKSRLFWRRAGYLQVGDDQYIAVMKSRLPFLIILLALIAVIIILLCLLTGPGNTPGNTPSDNPGNTPGTVTPGDTPGDTPGGDGPIVIAPDHPLPPVDENSQPIEGDTSEKADVSEGGGSVSMIYSLDSSLTLSNGDITIYFQNPNASSHNVTVDMYIVSGGQEYLIAQSGLLEPGFGLTKLRMMTGAPTLSEGIYGGLFRLHCYDPVTGEQAMVVPEITGLNITVTNG